MAHLLRSPGGGARSRRRRPVDRRAPAEDQQVRPVPPSRPVRGRQHAAANLPLAPHEPLPDHHRGRERARPRPILITPAQGVAPPAQGQPAQARQAELVICDQTIELAFERLKSLLGLGALPAKSADLARAWLWAKLILALLAEDAAGALAALSPSRRYPGRLPLAA